MYFDDLKTIPYLWGSSIVLHPKILCDFGVEYHEGWSGTGVKINKSDSSKIINAKINRIRKSLRKQYDAQNDTDKLSYPYRHEILFDKKIFLRKYAIAISCDARSDSVFDKILKIVRTKKYNFVVIRRHIDTNK